MSKPSPATKAVAAAYIRMSTDKQTDSPARQRADILALAEREGYEVTKWYEDHGKTGTESKKRTDFQRMMKDAQDGKFTALLLSEQSRLSREDSFEVFAYYKVLRDAGVPLYTSRRGRIDMDSIGGQITSLVDAHGANDESRKIADRVVTGKRAAIEKGRRQGGAIIGFDRIVRDAGGVLLRRVHFRERFLKPPGCTSELAVSTDAKAVRAIRNAFELVANGESLAHVQKLFNDAGVTSIMGNKFDNNDVRRLLTNPVYCGTLRHGAAGGLQSKFRRVLVESVSVENAHHPIVGRDLFDAVQVVLGSRLHKRTRGKAGQYLLHGIIRCGQCGKKMYGRREYGRKKYADSVSYRCVPDMRAAPNVTHGQIRGAFVEAAVIDIIRDKLLSRAGRALIAERVAALSRKSAPASPEQARLAELQADILRGQKNLARADTEADFAAISRSLAEWRKEADAIQIKLRQLVASAGKLTGDAAAVIGQLEWLCDNFEKAPRPRLTDAIKKFVDSIEIVQRKVNGFRVWSGVVHFSPEVSPDPYPLPNEEMVRGKVKEVVNHLRATGGQLLPLAIGAATGIKHRATIYNVLRRAERLGLVERETTGRHHHWRAVTAA